MSGTPRIVNPGYPPLIWSSVDEAFKAINQNFNDLYATIQADGSTEVVNFEQLVSDVAPESAGIYDLGYKERPWRSIYASAWREEEGSENNGLWAGDAQIKGIEGIIDLPANSTVNGELIIDPDKTFFKAVQIDGGNRVEADDFVDTLNLISGSSIGLTVDSAAESITISNLGVESVNASTGLSVNTNRGEVIITNTGVTSIANTQGLPDARTVGSGIRKDTSTGAVTLTNTGILQVDAGFGINVSETDGVATVSFNSGVAPQSAFTRIHIDGVSAIDDVISDSTADTLNLEPGYGMIMNPNPTTDRITFSVDQNIDINGSVYGDDSTIILVDGTNNTVPAENLTGTATIDLIGNTTGLHTGDVLGSIFADDSTQLIDAVDGKIVGPVENTAITTNTITGSSGLTIVGANTDTDGGTVVVVGGIGNGGDGGDITLAAGTGSAGVGGEITVAGGIGSTDGGEVSITGGIGSAGEGGPVSISGGSSATDGSDVTIYAGPGGPGYRNGVINIGTFNTSAVNIANATITGDLTGSVFADNSARLIDGVDGIIHAEYIKGTATIDVIGSIFADDSTLLVNGVDGSLAYDASTPGDWNGTPPATVGDALDRIAAWITANGGAGSP